MTKYILFIFMFAAIGFSKVFAQNELLVLADSVGALNNAINGDTTESGDRIPNRVYVLQRNRVYKTSGEIQNPGFHLRIKAEDGPGARPIIQPAVGSGGVNARPFTVLADLTLEGIYLTSVDELGGYINRHMRVRQDDVTVTLNDCWLDGTGQSVLRFDNKGGKAYITNCVGSHLGRTFVPNNGRFVDFRTDADSLIIRNSTFYNVTSRILRSSAARKLFYGEISNCTVVNAAQRVASFAEAAHIKFFNNLVINGSFIGDSGGGSIIAVDELSTANEEFYDSLGISREVELTNNWFYTTHDVREVWKDTAAWGFEVMEKQIFDGDFFPFIEDSIELVTNLTFYDSIQLKNAPGLPYNVTFGMINDQLFAESLDNGSAPNWNFTASPFFKVPTENLNTDENNQPLDPLYEFPYDFRFSPTSSAINRGKDGGQIGDPNWVPQAFDIVLGLDVNNGKPFRFYPNPTSSQLNISATLLEGLEEVSIISMNGKVVYSTNFSSPLQNAILQLPSVKTGLYLIQMRNEKGEVFSDKLIIK